ncbi:MAG: GNAT family N-acetyltransferase [Clostridiales bacterium]|nr:GNAT family N-acetyltransferase [Clostridiales bacterium]
MTNDSSATRLTILPAGPAHVDTVEAITRQTIAAVYPRYYPQGAVAFFQAHHSRERIARDVEAGRVFLAVQEGTPVGTVTLGDGEISRLFVLPEHQGKGAGRLLMQFAEETLFIRFETIVLHASLPAKRIYLKNGYAETAYHIIKTENGDFLCFDEMHKRR